MAMTDQENEALWEAVREAGVNWRPGHNTVTALSSDEQRRRLGYVPGDGEPSLEERESHASAQRSEMLATAAAPAAPAAIDWRNRNGSNYVTSIKDQGSCGSCVSFGAAATMESRARIVQGIPVNASGGGVLPSLSEAHLFYCGNTTTNPCADGWWPSAALAFATNTGVVASTCFPYTAGNQPCSLCANWQTMVTRVASSRFLTNMVDIKNSLITSGPLITCFSVYSDFYAYTGGTYRHASGAIEGGHCVSCVGFDDNAGAWLCKNSWGAGWGEGGFFWIGYGECGIDATMWEVTGFAQIYVPVARRRPVGH